VVEPVYAGLRQVLRKFRYGLDHDWLVVGAPSELTSETEEGPGDVLRLLRQSSVIPRYVAVKCITQGDAYFTQDVEPESKFHAQSGSHGFTRNPCPATLRPQTAQ
jgi:hypothetical protein